MASLWASNGCCNLEQNWWRYTGREGWWKHPNVEENTSRRNIAVRKRRRERIRMREKSERNDTGATILGTRGAEVVVCGRKRQESRLNLGGSGFEPARPWTNHCPRWLYIRDSRVSDSRPTSETESQKEKEAASRIEAKSLRSKRDEREAGQVLRLCDSMPRCICCTGILDFCIGSILLGPEDEKFRTFRIFLIQEIPNHRLCTSSNNAYEWDKRDHDSRAQRGYQNSKFRTIPSIDHLLRILEIAFLKVRKFEYNSKDISRRFKCKSSGIPDLELQSSEN